MSDATATLLVLAAATYGLKVAGPLALGGGRELPWWLDRLSTLLPASLLAALVATSTLVHDGRWIIDAKIVGLLAAAFALWRNAPFVVVVAVASVATAAARALA